MGPKRPRTKPGLMNRRSSRRHCFCIVYQLVFWKNLTAQELYRLYTNEFLSQDAPPDENPPSVSIPKGEAAFMLEIAVGVDETREFLDSTIEKHTSGWSLARLARVDLAILRMAIYELAFTPNTPTSVIINEAIELAKLYGDDEAPAFINGLLASASKNLRG